MIDKATKFLKSGTPTLAGVILLAGVYYVGGRFEIPFVSPAIRGIKNALA